MLHDLPSEVAYGEIFGSLFDEALDCTRPNDAACLRAASVASILAAQGEVFGANGISPDFGTKVLPSGLQQAFSTGEFIRVPVLQGTNANEGRLFEPLDFPFASTFPNILAAGGPANFDLSKPNIFCEAEGSGTPAVCTYPQEINLFLGIIGFPAAENTPALAALIAPISRIRSWPVMRPVPMRRSRRSSQTWSLPATDRIPTLTSRVLCRSLVMSSTIPMRHRLWVSAQQSSHPTTCSASRALRNMLRSCSSCLISVRRSAPMSSSLLAR